MKAKDAEILFVTGDKQIADEHWQARWRAKLTTGRQVSPDSDELRDPAKWSAKIADAVNHAKQPVVLVAHGRGISALVHAASAFSNNVAGAFLVAPADPSAKTAQANDNGGFGLLPRGPLPFQSLLVASRNDPACEFHAAEEFAADWGSQFMDAGAAGGIDAKSEFGPWPEGLMTFAKFISNLKAET